MKVRVARHAICVIVLCAITCVLQGCKQEDADQKSDAEEETECKQEAETSTCRKMWDETLNPLNLVPFYVYDFIDWTTMECGDLPKRSFIKSYPDNSYNWSGKFNYEVKHGDDIYFTGHALQHPARVFKKWRLTLL